jgi:hypothetical protein
MACCLSRSTSASLIMELQAAHLSLREAGRPYDLTKRTKFTQVWVWAAKIARSLGGAADWQHVERAKNYIRFRLGRLDGQTFLTNRSPIPEKGGNDGRPWRTYFEGRLPPGMLDVMLTRRHQMLRSLIDTHRPRVIICHGEPRSAHRALVLNGQVVPNDQSRIEQYDLADGRHVFICPFFGVGQMSTPDAQDLVDKLRDRGVRL